MSSPYAEKESSMNMEPNRLSRRTLLMRGMGFFGLIAGGLIGSSSLAELLAKPTPRQALGPFFPDDGDEVEAIRENPDPRLPISQANDQDLTFVKGRKGQAKGQVIYLRGRVLAAPNSQAIPHAVIIMWSASASGRYNHKGDEGNTSFPHPKTGEIIHRTHDEHFQYWGRTITTDQGEYWFKTIVPGFYPIDLETGLYRPSHLHFAILPPGIPKLVTQLYFRGEHIPNNTLNQELLPKDVVIRDAGLAPQEQESVIVDYAPDPSGKITDGLVGHYNFVIPG
jgi:protocatechuate 3,4-dioxygenase beta subunit